MEMIEAKVLTWEEIKTQHLDEWVVLGNPMFEGMRIMEGIVLAHHPDKRVASIEGGERREGFKKFTLTFTGQHTASYHIGLLRTLKKSV